MAQAQLNTTQFYLTEEGISGLLYQLEKGQITCVLNEQHALIVKRKKYCTSIVLKTGSRYFRLSPDFFERRCDLKLSVKLIIAFLEGNTF